MTLFTCSYSLINYDYYSTSAVINKMTVTFDKQTMFKKNFEEYGASIAPNS